MSGAMHARRQPVRRDAAIAAAVLGAAAVLAAAGLGRAAPAPRPILLKAREFLFDPKELTVRAGETTFEVRNEGAIEHNFVVEDAAKKALVEIAIIEAGKTESAKATLRAGTYAYVCTLPGHREAGMIGVLRVQP